MTGIVVNSYQNVNWSHMDNFNDLLQNANQSGAGWLFAGIDFLVFAVLFITLSVGFGWEVALMSSGFITIILSLLFAYMGVLSWTYTGISIGLILVMIMYVIWSNKWD
jgi:hypothetical protein